MMISRSFSLRFAIVLFTLHSLAPAWSENYENKLGSGYEFANNGKVKGSDFAQVYKKNRPGNLRIKVTDDCRNAALCNLKILGPLSDKTFFRSAGLSVSGKQLKKTGTELANLLKKDDADLSRHFEFWQIKGEDGRGNVHFTGYFTPKLAARKMPDATFKYPIYALPSGKNLPTRQAIDHEGALAGKGLELAYTSSLLDNYFLSVQGSGLLDFGNGKVRKIGYAGQNGHPYRSIGRILVAAGHIPAEKISLRAIRNWLADNPQQMAPVLNQNQSYCFFTWRKEAITGGAGVELTPMHSVAVDKKFIPYGACLLAEVPFLDDSGNLLGHNWQILFAHDTGGAIRGPGHLDLYHGTGSDAGDKAGDLHHYGRVWLILSRE